MDGEYPKVMDGEYFGTLMGPGPCGPEPVWARAYVGPGPGGPRPMWARAHLGLPEGRLTPHGREVYYPRAPRPVPDLKIDSKIIEIGNLIKCFENV